ncbi:MAG: glycosyltransferase family 9 protein, partial [Burkholderiales bacterium]|nr:glycosyltransferase family 9 protein [Burkholderiales bacterium]
YHWLSCNKLAHFSRVNSPLHEAQLNFALLRPLGVTLVPSLPQLVDWYGVSAEPDPAHAQWCKAGARHIILHPKSNGNGREWPLASFLQLVQSVAGDASWQFWLTGSAKEGEFLAEHAPQLVTAPNVQNLCGKLDLGGLARLMTRADGLVASGTGPLHMAAALGRPCVGLFPPIKPIDPARWGALGKQAQSLVGASACNSCTGAAQCQCMQAITPAQVLAALAAGLA